MGCPLGFPSFFSQPQQEYPEKRRACPSPRKKKLIEATNTNAKDGLGNVHLVNLSNVVQLEPRLSDAFELLTDRSNDTFTYSSTQHS